MIRAIVDTGPIVAILSQADNHHQKCVETLKIFQPPLLTTWSVFTEAQYLLRRDTRVVKGLFRAFDSGLFEIEELSSKALPWLEKFLLKYKDRQPQIADASIMYLAEKSSVFNIFTLDQRDFSIYRFSNRKAPSIYP